jgi:tRNA synthetase class I (K)
MSPRPFTATLRTPHIVATGFTSALLGDERTLREFVAGDHVVRELREKGVPAALYLFNDTYDPLSERQLRVAVDKDERLTRMFAPYCGRPIAEIPDPFGCHPSFARHFLELLLDRLYGLDIHPQVFDVHSLYQQGVYAPSVIRVLERHEAIQQMLAEHLESRDPPRVFRVQCSRCQCIDATRVLRAGEPGIDYHCERCSADAHESLDTVRGKLSWKLDCAARWNLFRIDTEVFAKAHSSGKGTLDVAAMISRHVFGGHAPEIVRYGDLRLDRSLSGRLLAVLPAPLLKRMLTEHLVRDLHVTPEYVTHFAEVSMVRPGLSYADFVRQELPKLALHGSPQDTTRIPARRPGLSDADLVAHGKAFSELFFDRRHEIKLPDPEALPAAPADVLAVAHGVVDLALRLRGEPQSTPDTIKQQLRTHLATQPAAPGVYPFMRKLLRQDHGPNLTTVLSLMPLGYLLTVRGLLASYPSDSVSPRSGDAPEASRRAA